MGRHVVGYDIDPLARLVAEVKSMPIGDAASKRLTKPSPFDGRARLPDYIIPIMDDHPSGWRCGGQKLLVPGNGG